MMVKTGPKSSSRRKKCAKWLAALLQLRDSNFETRKIRVPSSKTAREKQDARNPRRYVDFFHFLIFGFSIVALPKKCSGAIKNVQNRKSKLKTNAARTSALYFFF